MSILVKGMKMPKVCADCPFRKVRYDPGYHKYEHCRALGKIFNEHSLEIDVFEEKLNDCPLIEIADTEWEWCHDCKEYDQEAHCCHRWTKVIRRTVEDVKESYKIVTCGECNRSGTDGENTFCMWLGALRKPTDFCSYGERRNDEIDRR